MILKQPVSLYEAEKHGVFIVVSIPNILALENMGLRPGADITVKSRYRLGGPVLVRIGESYDLAIGKDIARQIAVEPFSKPGLDLKMILEGTPEA